LVLQPRQPQVYSAILRLLDQAASVAVQAHLVERLQTTAPLEAPMLEVASHSVNPNQPSEVELEVDYSAPLAVPVPHQPLVPTSPVHLARQALGPH
jgi:hypothetical protein